MSPYKKLACLGFLLLHCFIILNYNLLGIKSYEKEHVFEELSPNGQRVFTAIQPAIPRNVPALVRPYAHFAGINTGYSLFAPNVPSAMAVIFELTNEAGESTVMLPMLNSTEGLARLHGNYNFFSAFEDFRELLAYGWAMRMLEMNPGYNKAAVVIGAHRMPSMEAYRNGKRSTFLENGVYEFKLEQ